MEVEQTYEVFPDRIEMTFRVQMTNNTPESYSCWTWEFWHQLENLKARDEDGTIKVTWGDWEFKVCFREPVEYGSTYEYTVSSTFQPAAYAEIERFVRFYPFFGYYPTKLVVVHPQSMVVDFPFEGERSISGGKVTLKSDVEDLEYVAIFIETYDYKEQKKSIRLKGRKLEIIAKYFDSDFAKNNLELAYDILSNLERLTGVPFPMNIDKIYIFQINRQEVAELKISGLNFGRTGMATYYKDKKGIAGLMSHEYAHYWFSGNERWIDEGNANFYEYLNLQKLGYRDEAEEDLSQWKMNYQKLNVPLCQASYEKYRQALYTAGAMFMYDLHERYGLSKLQKLNKYIVPERVNCFEYYYYAEKAFGRDLSSMFSGRIFVKEDMGAINSFKNAYDDYLSMYENALKLYRGSGFSTWEWEAAKEEILDQVDWQNFSTTDVEDELELYEKAKEVISEYQKLLNFIEEMESELALKGIEIELLTEELEDIKRDIEERKLSKAEEKIEDAKEKLEEISKNIEETISSFDEIKTKIEAAKAMLPEGLSISEIENSLKEIQSALDSMDFEKALELSKELEPKVEKMSQALKKIRDAIESNENRGSGKDSSSEIALAFDA
ncbi:MAG: hypothetical protein ACE5K0_12795, partial [Candidatus Methanofastidiosia archaeon]